MDLPRVMPMEPMWTIPGTCCELALLSPIPRKLNLGPMIAVFRADRNHFLCFGANPRTLVD